MKALVTGGTGFLGSRLVHNLVENGHEVGVLTRPESSLTELADVTASIRVHAIGERPEHVERVLASDPPDVVFHVATYYQRDHQPADLAPLLEANVAFPLRLLDAMARTGVRRFVNTGSAWQYSEPQTYRPVCLHSASKHAFESFLAYYVESGAIDAITLVMHDTYGPADPRRKIFTLLRENTGKTVPLDMSGGEQILNLIHVQDAVAAYAVAAQRLMEPRDRCAHEIYSVSGCQPRSLRQIVESYLEHAALDVPIRWGGRAYHPREVMHAWQGGASLPGWKPEIDLDTGLRELARAADDRTPMISQPV